MMCSAVWTWQCTPHALDASSIAVGAVRALELIQAEAHPADMRAPLWQPSAQRRRPSLRRLCRRLALARAVRRRHLRAQCAQLDGRHPGLQPVPRPGLVSPTCWLHPCPCPDSHRIPERLDLPLLQYGTMHDSPTLIHCALVVQQLSLVQDAALATGAAAHASGRKGGVDLLIPPFL